MIGSFVKQTLATYLCAIVHVRDARGSCPNIYAELQSRVRRDPEFLTIRRYP